MKNFFKRILTKDKKKEFVFTTRNLADMTANGERISRTPQGNSSGIITIDSIVQNIPWVYGTNSSTSMGGTNPSPILEISEPKKDERKEVKPIDVFNEIKKEGLEPDFSNLDNKIRVVEERLEMLKEHLDNQHLSDENKALFFLKNRRKYIDTRKKNPFDWAMTNREAIDDLCKRYKLQTVPLKQFYTLVPNEGLKEMKRFTKAYKVITGDNPIFELIVKDIVIDQTVKEEEKENTEKEAKKIKQKDRDPILVANSPFGNFMFVLGVWDDEVEIIDEIIYEGK